jgi:hypothetical protein
MMIALRVGDFSTVTRSELPAWTAKNLSLAGNSISVTPFWAIPIRNNGFEFAATEILASPERHSGAFSAFMRDVVARLIVAVRCVSGFNCTCASARRLINATMNAVANLALINACLLFMASPY